MHYKKNEYLLRRENAILRYHSVIRYAVSSAAIIGLPLKIALFASATLCFI